MIIDFSLDSLPYNVMFTFTPFNQFLLGSLLQKQEFSTLPIFVVNTSRQHFLHKNVTVLNFHDRHYSGWQLVRRYRSVGDTLISLRKGGRISSVTAPHPHNIFSNDLMLRHSEFPVNVYEDGIANYCASDNVGILRKQSRIKAAIAPLLGCRYRDYSGHITGIDQRVYQRGYFLSPANVYAGSRFLSVDQIDIGVHDQKNSGLLQDCVLVLDQDIEFLFDEHASRKLRARLVSFVKSLGVKIYVKPHPGQSRSELASYFGDAVVLIESLQPAELVALELRPKYLVSFISGALKNVAGFLPGVRCYSFGAVELDGIRGTHLVKVFSDFNVNVL